MSGTTAASVRIAGVGTALPATVVRSIEVEERAGLCARFGVEPGWLERVTGVRERRWASPGVRPSDLAAEAGRRALADAGRDATEVDTVLFTGITRDFLEPATANVVAQQVGTRGARVFDVVNACNGFVDGIDLADILIRAGRARRVLVTTGERVSMCMDWAPATFDELQRAVGSLVVGDGGGALVLEAGDDPARGLRQRAFRGDASQWALAVGGRLDYPMRDGVPSAAFDPRFHSDGRRVLLAVVGLLEGVMEEALERTGWSWHDVDLVFCHEASRRFVEAGLARLRLARPDPPIWTTVERFGNSVTYSLPLAMEEARLAGALRRGARVLVAAGSSGVSAAALTLVW